MNKYLSLLLILFAGSAFADSTANQVTPGSLTISGCPGSELSCFIPYSNANPLPVSSAGASASATTVLNGSITVGNTFQQIAASNTSRKSFEFQNTNASHTCYLFFGTTVSASTAASITVPPSGFYIRSSGAIPSDALQVTCTNTSDTFYADVQ